MHADISSGPSNITLLMNDLPQRFSCTGQGTFLWWLVDGSTILPGNEEYFQQRIGHDNGTITIHIFIDASVENNNTQFRCLARDGNSTTVISEPAYLNLIGIAVYTYI